MLFVSVLTLFICNGALNKIRNVGILLGIGIIGICILWFVLPFVIEHILARLGEADISNGRNELFAWYNDYLVSDFEHLWFGTGLQDILARVNEGCILTIDNCSQAS